MKIFLAGPFFTQGEEEFMEKLKAMLEDLGHEVISPLDIGFQKGGSEELFQKDLGEISRCDALFAILDGLDPGTMCEIGYARAMGKKIVGIWTHKEKVLDPFVEWMCKKVIGYEDLKKGRFWH
jgi:nucleoside 2-deoxyribosyltransferase